MLFGAAARAEGNRAGRLGGVLDAFIQWCEETREDLRLEEEIDAQLAQRKQKLAMNQNCA